MAAKLSLPRMRSPDCGHSRIYSSCRSAAAAWKSLVAIVCQKFSTICLLFILTPSTGDLLFYFQHRDLCGMIKWGGVCYLRAGSVVADEILRHRNQLFNFQITILA